MREEERKRVSKNRDQKSCLSDRSIKQEKYDSTYHTSKKKTFTTIKSLLNISDTICQDIFLNFHIDN